MAWFKRKEKSQVTVTAEVARPGNGYTAPPDQRTNFCPNCGGELKKVPGAKTKCPHCGRFMYVRTDPRINVRIVVGEDELEAVDDAIAKANGTWEERKADKAHRAKVTAELTKSFGFTPSEADVNWRVLNEDFLDASRHRDEYKMFVTAGDMTTQLVREKKYRDAMRMVARPVVMSWVDFGDIPPAWVDVVSKALKSGIDLDDAKQLFLDGISGAGSIAKYRVDGSEVWKDVIRSLDDAHLS